MIEDRTGQDRDRAPGHVYHRETLNWVSRAISKVFVYYPSSPGVHQPWMVMDGLCVYKNA